MTSLAVVDAGPLYAAADTDDRDHRPSRAVLERSDLHLIVPALVVAEATYFVGRQLGAAAESQFLRGIGGLDVEGTTREDFTRMAELVDRYADFPLGGTDASVIPRVAGAAPPCATLREAMTIRLTSLALLLLLLPPRGE